MNAETTTGDPREPPAGPPMPRRIGANVTYGLEDNAHFNAPVLSGEALKDWREARGLSRPALAKMLDICTATIQRYERGARLDRGRRGDLVAVPKLFRLALAALALGIKDYSGYTVVRELDK